MNTTLNTEFFLQRKFDNLDYCILLNLLKLANKQLDKLGENVLELKNKSCKKEIDLFNFETQNLIEFTQKINQSIDNKSFFDKCISYSKKIIRRGEFWSLLILSPFFITAFWVFSNQI